MNITRAMGEAAKRELETGEYCSYSDDLDRAFYLAFGDEWILCDDQYPTALAMIMAIAGVE